MIGFEKMFKEFHDQIDSLPLPLEMKARVNKFKQDVIKTAADDKLTDEQKNLKLEYLKNSFLADNNGTKTN